MLKVKLNKEATVTIMELEAYAIVVLCLFDEMR